MFLDVCVLEQIITDLVGLGINSEEILEISDLLEAKLEI